MNILTPDKISDIKSDVKASDFQSLKEFAEGLDQAIVSAQRDLTASIKDAECVKIGQALMQKERYDCKARIEALIEPLKYIIDRCTEVMEGYNQGLTPDKVDWAGIVGEADKRARKALATHTSKGEEQNEHR